jgi:hypothetical protein
LGCIAPFWLESSIQNATSMDDVSVARPAEPYSQARNIGVGS